MHSLPELSSVHERYLLLARHGRGVAGERLGKLLLHADFNAEGIATALAASVAGAASLCVDGEAGRLRSGLRTGLIDFVVGNLDEALRILKNEVRRGVAISVGLGEDPAQALAAMIERGVQPDLLFLPAVEWAAQRGVFEERGAVRVPAALPPDGETFLLSWCIQTEGVRALHGIAQAANAALDPQHPETPARRRWLEAAPRSMGRNFGSRQCLRMTEAEMAALLPELRRIAPSAVVTRDGQPL